ncbi:hypothetical protein C8Q78DRAFT_1083089 [Trametes maxima]|nr:hypothetical protein C8Q78DRAFT_1083089 [Trametes maxima]
MTKYDYSPDAYESFQTEMTGIGDWKSPSSDTTCPSTPTHSSRSQSKLPHPPDPVLLPAKTSLHKPIMIVQPAPAPGPSSPSTSLRTPAATAGHHEHTPTPNNPRVTRAGIAQSTVRLGGISAAHLHKVVPRTSPITYVPPAPAGYRTRQPIVLPPPRPGETYVIIPPKGGRVDVVRDPRSSSSSHSRSQSMSRLTSQSSRSIPSNPTKKSNEALTKRLLTNLTPNVEWGNSSGTRSSS